MATPSGDPNPFGELGGDPRDRLPPAKTAGQVASGLVGFGIMGLGGIIVLAGVLAKFAGGFLWVVILPLGIGVCYLGYWLYGRGQARTRRGRTARPDERDEPARRPARRRRDEEDDEDAPPRPRRGRDAD